MSASRQTLQKVLGIVRAMEFWSYRDSDFSAVRLRLESEISAKKAPLRSSDTIERLPAVPGCLIRKEHVRAYVGASCSVTFYDSGMNPKYRRGILTDCTPARIRIETLSARAWYVQYSRIIRFEVFEGGRAVMTIWHDLHVD